jgi:uncharacterized membrane protein
MMLAGSMISKRIDLTGGFWWALLLLLTVLVTDNFVMRLILSLPLMFLLTGHTLLRAIKPFQTGLLEHMVFAVGLSIALCVGGGFLLNTVSGLNPIGWAIWLMVVNGVAAVIARRQPYEPIVLPALPRIRPWHAFTFCAVVGILTASYVSAAHIINAYQEFKYTEFWLIPEPISGNLVIGVKNQETKPEEYDIDVNADTTLIAAFRSIHLAPGEKWVREITIGLNQRRVEAHLYRTRDHALYRKVWALTPGSG